MKKQRLLFFLSAFALLVTATIVYLLAKKENVQIVNSRPTGALSGSVFSIIDKPNMAEDGVYKIGVLGDHGQYWTIDATGYLNKPLTPESQGETCVDIPKVKLSDKVSFILPRDNNQENGFDICYSKNLSGYFFNVDHTASN